MEPYGFDCKEFVDESEMASLKVSSDLVHLVRSTVRPNWNDRLNLREIREHPFWKRRFQIEESINEDLEDEKVWILK